jgi:hypothetical protein
LIVGKPHFASPASASFSQHVNVPARSELLVAFSSFAGRVAMAHITPQRGVFLASRESHRMLTAPLLAHIHSALGSHSFGEEVICTQNDLSYVLSRTHTQGSRSLSDSSRAQSMAAPAQVMRREVIGQPLPQLTVDRMQGVPHPPPFARLRNSGVKRDGYRHPVSCLPLKVTELVAKASYEI